MARRHRKRRERAPQRPLCALLLPGQVEQAPALAEELLRAPGAVAVEPAALGYEATSRLPRMMRERIAAGQARRMALPGQPRAVVVFGPPQYPLARALLAEYADAELWYGGEPHPAADARAALRFDAATDARVLWERMEALGIESGRLGSQRLS